MSKPRIYEHFDSRDAALDYVADLLTTHDAAFLDEVSVTSDRGHELSGDALREALAERIMETPLPPGAIEIPW